MRLLTAVLMPAIAAGFSLQTTSTCTHQRRYQCAFSLQAKKSKYDDSIFGSFEEGNVKVSRGDNKDAFALYYRLYNQQASKPPLVVLHGGPSLPSQYLYPMVPNLNEDRPILFYDQLGCGKSDEPRDKRLYSIAQSISDLDIVLQALGYGQETKIHLFGHSYGGCLAYEYSKQRPQQIKSLVLANTPNNMKVAGDSYDQLARKNPLGFWKQRVLSVDSPALDDALDHTGSVWAGMDVVLDYVATPVAESIQFPNTLIISSPNDFALESSRDWKSVLGGTNVEEASLEKCAHYPHLEDGPAFGRKLDEFLSKNDN